MVKLSALVHCLVVQTATSTMAPAIHVVSRYLPGEGLSKSAAEGGPVLNAADARNDNMDLFNHPRIRRALILQSMNDIDAKFIFETPSAPSKNLDDYKLVCSDPLLEFFSTAYDRWHAMGAHGQDPDSTRTLEEDLDDISHPLIPGNVLLPREPFQRPSNNVMGQIGYYCTDTLTPVFKELKEELLWDSAVVKQAIERLKDPKSNNMVYALGTHPGHHASFDSFGGYCYLNHSAFAARLLQKAGHTKVAVLDVDYHGGNGSQSIFYEDPTVLMISIHCHPDHEYPFHSGNEEETGRGAGEGTTLNLPLLPKTTWNEYKPALEKAVKRIQEFGATALVVSLGLDTLEGDPCAVRRAGFKLSGNDYLEMGKTIGHNKIPTLFIQEGGYQMDNIAKAAADVLAGFAESQQNVQGNDL